MKVEYPKFSDFFFQILFRHEFWEISRFERKTRKDASGRSVYGMDGSVLLNTLNDDSIRKNFDKFLLRELQDRYIPGLKFYLEIKLLNI